MSLNSDACRLSLGCFAFDDFAFADFDVFADFASPSTTTDALRGIFFLNFSKNLAGCVCDIWFVSKSSSWSTSVRAATGLRCCNCGGAGASGTYVTSFFSSFSPIFFPPFCCCVGNGADCCLTSATFFHFSASSSSTFIFASSCTPSSFSLSADSYSRRTTTPFISAITGSSMCTASAPLILTNSVAFASTSYFCAIAPSSSISRSCFSSFFWRSAASTTSFCADANLSDIKHRNGKCHECPSPINSSSSAWCRSTTLRSLFSVNMRSISFISSCTLSSTLSAP
mmetsp:Transcript_8516/g.14010  ORF Transcript_8516/g.14010 Transcript_8516/m.14010 type:complete len:284 (+) Transcript_8516:274-1125(+)